MKHFIAIACVLFSTVILGQTKMHPKVGDAAPYIETLSIDSQIINSSDIVKKKKLLVVFYRGEWCPICKKYIYEVEQKMANLSDFIEVVLISPEQPEYASEMISKDASNIHIVSDSSYSLMKKFNVDYKISRETVPRYFDFVKCKTRKHNSNEDDILPIPATFLIDSNHRIEFVHFDEDYRNRADLQEILETIQ